MTIAARYGAFTERLFGQNQFAIRYDLEAMRETVERLGGLPPARRSVLVGGTNGKGTTASFLHAFACAAGLRCGLYTSPHLVDFRERIRVNGRPIPVDATVALGEQLLRRFSGQECPAEGPRALSYFELATALAMEHFRASGPLDLIVWEVGMGGRLDATNATDPDVSVLTGVAFDHEAWLGHTLDAIAKEKVGIVRPGRPVVLHAGSGGYEPLRAACRHAGVVDAQLHVETAGDDPRGWALALASRAFRLLFEGELGEAATASAIEEGTRRARWPGRQQRLDVGGTTWLIDGAHNEQGAEACRVWLDGVLEGQPASVALVGTSPGKLPEKVVSPFVEAADHVVVTQASTSRATPATEVAESLRRAGLRVDVVEPDVRRALELASERAEGGVVATGGSLYLVGDVLAWHGFDADSLDVLAADAGTG